jgi:hypothetical protein
MPAATRITRSWFNTIFWAVIAAGCLAFLVFVFVVDERTSSRIMGVVLIGGLGLGCTWLAVRGSDEAPCPGCGEAVQPNGDRESLCKACGALSLQRAREMVPLGDDHVASTRRFALPLGGLGVAMPPVCAACGAPATRTVEVSYRLSFLWKAVITVSAAASGSLAYADERVTAKVPTCDHHDDGGEIVDMHKNDLLLCVRSWGFARRFQDANRCRATLV